MKGRGAESSPAAAPPRADVRALLNRLIDYAGLFPPAKLDMAATVRSYDAYLRGEHQWMMGRLIVPAARLDEFDACAAELLEQASADGLEPWVLSVLAAPAGSADLEKDLARIEAFNLQHEDEAPAMIDMIELKGDAAAAIDQAIGVIPEDLFPFFEIPIDKDPRGMIATLVEGDAGAKVRTGGVTADLYPSPEHLARFIAACAAANVPFKATAGMHHPIRHFSKAVQTKEHGFLNVFLAGCLALTHELPEADVARLLGEESAEAFRFNGDSIEWSGHRVDAANVEDVRECFAASFGSCSFEEPIEDLKKLSLL